MKNFFTPSMILLCSWLCLNAHAQVPAINSFSPAKARVGAIITINGSNFNTTAANNVVHFNNGTKAVVQSATATQLTVVVPATVSGYISILNKSTGLSSSSKVEFNVTSPQLTSVPYSFFEDRVSVSSAYNVKQYILTDLDEDGKADLIVANAGKNSLTFYKNASAPGDINSLTFATKTNIGPAEDYMQYAEYGSVIQLADINGDGKTDILAKTRNNNRILLNTSVNGQINTSSFNTTVDLQDNYFVRDIADMDGDGKPDLIINKVDYYYDEYLQSYFPYIAKQFIMVNTTAKGSLAPTFTQAPDLINWISRIADFDGDGLSDYITGDNGFVRNTSAPGNLAFAAKVTIPDFSNMYNNIMKDFDGDGKIDIITPLVTQFKFYRNTSTQGNIHFSTSTIPLPVNNVYSIIPEDMDGDGKPDLILQHRYAADYELTILLNKTTPGNVSAASFRTRFDLPVDVNNGDQITYTADLDGDSKADFIVVSDKSFNIIRRGENQLKPKITDALPMRARPGDVVTIRGKNFHTEPDKNIVMFGAVKAVVKQAGKTQLKVTVPVGSSYQPVEVTNLATALSSSTTDNFIAQFLSSSNSFSPGVTYTGGNNPAAAALADVDGDGKVDMVVANAGSNNVSVYLNTATSGTLETSSFAARVNFATGARPVALAVKDVTGDGKPDIITANETGGTVSILRNTATKGAMSSSAFATKFDLVAGEKPSAVAVGDLNNDGRPDVVVTNYASNTASVFRNTIAAGKNNNLPSFAAKVDLAAGNNPTGVVIADMNGNGLPEIIVSKFTDSNVSVFNNNSTKEAFAFSARLSFKTGVNTRGVAVGDVDGDGKADLVTVNEGGKSVSVLRNTTTGTTISMAAKVDLSTGPGSFAIALADVNGDGKVDIVTGSSSLNSITVFANKGMAGTITTNSFEAWPSMVTGTKPTHIATGDMDGDGQTDLLVTNYGGNSLSAFRNGSQNAAADGTPAVSVNEVSPLKTSAGSDIIIKGKNFSATPSKNIVSIGGIRANVTSATATQLVVQAPVGTTLRPVTVLNTSSKSSARNFIPFSNTFPSKTTIDSLDFSPERKLPNPDYTSIVGVFDLDGDGKLDLLGTRHQHICLYRNISQQGTLDAGSFAPKVEVYSENAGGLQVVDIDNDGKLDLVSSGYQKVVIFKNNTVKGSFDKSSFIESAVIPFSDQIGAITAADMDGDGKVDLIINDPPFEHDVNTKVDFVRNVGKAGIINSSSFQRNSFTIPGMISSINITDMNNDNKPDFVIRTPDSFDIYQNTMTAGSALSLSAFRKTSITFLSPYDELWFIGDMNNDGKPDFVFANQLKNNISVLENNLAGNDITSSSFLSTRWLTIPLNDIPASSMGLLRVADLNGDGKLDILLNVSIYNTKTRKYDPMTRIFTSTGNTSPFFKRTNIASSFYANFHIADLDADGRPDLIARDNNSANISVIKNLLPDNPDLTATFSAAPKQYILSVYPNPSADGVGFALTNFKGSKVDAVLTNLNGRIIHTESVKIDPNTAYYKLNPGSKPSAGIYVLNIKAPGLNESSKVIIE